MILPKGTCGWPPLRLTLVYIFLCLILTAPGCNTSPKKERQLTHHEKQNNLSSFEQVWRTIRDKNYDATLGGLDWQRVHDELLPLLTKANTQTEARLVLMDMVSRLNQAHFAIIPAPVFTELKGKIKKENDPKPLTNGTSGIDLRIIDGQAVVTKVENNSPANQANIHPGWIIVKINHTPIPPFIQRIANQYEKKSWKNLMVTSAIKQLLTGTIGQKLILQLIDVRNQTIEKTLLLTKGKGTNVNIGYFDLGYIWCEKKLLANNIGYIYINGFTNSGQVLQTFNNAIQEFMNTKGIILDIRGNRGGLASIIKGVAGWFIEKEGTTLGTLITRNSHYRFFISPRIEVYQGYLAILIDNCTSSAAEYFASGMQDLGRARLFGENSAGSAQPSNIIALPNGDAFQYAFADYVSVNGHKLEGYGIILNDPITLSREDLLQGIDPVIDAAIEWLEEKTI